VVIKGLFNSPIITTFFLTITSGKTICQAEPRPAGAGGIPSHGIEYARKMPQKKATDKGKKLKEPDWCAMKRGS
jgi:hypothetical protein